MKSRKIASAAGAALVASILYLGWPGTDATPSAVNTARASAAKSVSAHAAAASRNQVDPVDVTGNDTDVAGSASPAAPDAGFALSASPRDLFTFIPRPAQADVWERRLDAPSDHIDYVRINPAMALGKASPFWATGGGGTFQIVLGDGRIASVVIDQTRQGSDSVDSFVSSGHLAGDDASRVFFSYRNGEMSAVIEGAQAGSWQLRAVAGGVAQLFEVNPAKVPDCGVDAKTNDPQKMALLARRAVGADQVKAAAVTTAGAALGSSPPSVQNVTSLPSRADVRILFVYTEGVAAVQSASAVGTQADLAISILNDDLARSLVDATVSLAGVSQVAYDESKSAADKVQSEALDRLSDESDGFMDSVHALRDQLGADLVCLALNRADSGSAGIAYIMSHPRNRFNDTSGFSVVQYSVMNTQSVFSHEIGHNLGCAHDRENSKDSDGKLSPGAYSYSYGYRFTGADGVQYRTIMSYTPGRRLSYFSNPQVTSPAPSSHVVGSPEGQPDEADNARTIREDVIEVAGYRLNTAAANGNAGILLNVSTRAFVSAGERQLIGGFILSGTQPKKMLIRAIGPTLSQYSVGDALSDPILHLVRQANGALVDENDNWGSNAAAVTAAIAQAKAFPLPNGSRDAVVVATLQPGVGYSANVEGANGATGTALVEAYILESSGTRLANLSTRAYADVSKPMIGGFIVQADPGSPNKTKRLAIRVLGPSLANFGVAAAMNDPIFTLHDAGGAVVLTNDDWASSSTGGDDNKPVAGTAAQKELVAVGLAPPNRRDSGVLVDLAPGAYTAVVRPFEELPDQVQKPGIALVEVYEITP